MTCYTHGYRMRIECGAHESCAAGDGKLCAVAHPPDSHFSLCAQALERPWNRAILTESGQHRALSSFPFVARSDLP